MGKNSLSAVALVSLIACSPGATREARDCVSLCGSILTNVDTCSGWDEHEAATIAALEKHVGALSSDVCMALKDWWFRIIDTNGRGWWQDSYGRKVAGLTHFNSKIVELGSPCWGKNSYTHEVGHIYDGFMGTFRQDDHHWQWEERGFYRAIQETRIEDTCKNLTTGEQ